jgi:UDP-N-acetyl-D-mannosaminuronic acid transferase (WecB/TagA/CpsF family)
MEAQDGRESGQDMTPRANSSSRLQIAVRPDPVYGSAPKIDRRREPRGDEHQLILGLPFFTGTVQQAIDRMRRGGLLVVPAAPALVNLGLNVGYREALLGADLVIPDSAYMVMIWNLIGRRIKRISGLKYLRVLLMQGDVREFGNTLWIMAGERSAECNMEWLRGEGIHLRQDCIYIAPMYGKGEIVDRKLLEMIEESKPRHVVVTLGGGNQERLGLYLRRNLSYRPAIHCIGAAIAFLSGDQVHIPHWADKLYMGWFFRILWKPKSYLPRYWAARNLLQMILKYREELPPYVR